MLNKSGKWKRFLKIIVAKISEEPAKEFKKKMKNL